jgi:hypothetical protein
MISTIIAGIGFICIAVWSHSFYEQVRDRTGFKIAGWICGLAFFVAGSLAVALISSQILKYDCADSHDPWACEADARGDDD